MQLISLNVLKIMSVEMMSDEEVFKLLNPDKEPPKKEEINWDLLEETKTDKIELNKDDKYNLNFNFIQ